MNSYEKEGAHRTTSSPDPCDLLTLWIQGSALSLNKKPSYSGEGGEYENLLLTGLNNHSQMNCYIELILLIKLPAQRAGLKLRIIKQKQMNQVRICRALTCSSQARAVNGIGNVQPKSELENHDP